MFAGLSVALERYGNPSKVRFSALKMMPSARTFPESCRYQSRVDRRPTLKDMKVAYTMVTLAMRRCEVMVGGSPFAGATWWLPRRPGHLRSEPATPALNASRRRVLPMVRSERYR